METKLRPITTALKLTVSVLPGDMETLNKTIDQVNEVSIAAAGKAIAKTASIQYWAPCYDHVLTFLTVDDLETFLTAYKAAKA